MQILRVFAILITLFSLSCTTVVLNNSDVLKPPMPDAAVLEQPTCLKLNFETDNLGPFNEQEGVREMEELYRRKASVGLKYFNIILECETPEAEYTLRISSQTRHWWARSIWAVSSYVTLGIIPFYVKEIGTVKIIDKSGKVIDEILYEERRLTSFLVAPKWFMDFSDSADLYSVPPDAATFARKEAILLKRVHSKKQP